MKINFVTAVCDLDISLTIAKVKSLVTIAIRGAIIKLFAMKMIKGALMVRKMPPKGPR